MKLEYRITDEIRKKIFVETGRKPDAWQQIEVDPTEISADDRRLLVALRPNLVLDHIRLDVPVWRDNSNAVETITLPAPAADAADLLAQYRALLAPAEAAFAAARDAQARKMISEYLAWNSETEPHYRLFHEFALSPLRDELVHSYNTAKARAAEIRAVQRAARQRKEEEAVAEKAAREAERRAWALAHGSPRLRKCVEMDYDCQRLYALERAALEHPAYVLDFDDKATWKPRSGPSEAALDEARRVGGEVVWLTRFPAPDGLDQDLYDEDEECEAVVIRQYLGKYDLIKRI